MHTQLRTLILLAFASSACAASVGCIGSVDSEEQDVATSELALTVGAAIKGVQSNRCLDVQARSQADGTPVNIYDCNGGTNQHFSFTSAGELRAYDGAVCVQTLNGLTANSTPVVIGACNGSVNQQWRANGDQTIRHVQTSQCLDVTGNATANRTPLNIYPCKASGNDNQKFIVTSPPDPQAPTAPADVTLSNVTCESATVAWSASSDNVGVVGYDVYHDGQFMKSVGGSTLQTSITLVPGVTWGIYVNARDAAGNVSQASATNSITVPQCQVDTIAPTSPTGLRASVNGTTITLQWTASTDNVNVRFYDIFRAGVRVGTVTGSATVPAATTFVDSGLAANTRYRYTVVARDAQANQSAPSGGLDVTTGQACADAICSVTQVGTDSDIPWGLVTLPNGDIVYSRRDAHDVVKLNPTTGAKVTLGTVPNVRSTDGEGGLLGLAIAPTFATDRWLYMMHTSPTDNRVVRMQLTTGNALDTSTLQVLLTGMNRNKYHNGGRLRFGPDGKLYIAIGDGQNDANAQSLSVLSGKILRINPDGSIPSDNPFGNAIWSYGHRNPQGLAFDSQGRLWEQEFGNSKMDETNLIVRGGNYGWPSCEGTSSNSGQGCATPGFLAPKRTYPTADASCSGIAIVRDSLYIACQRGTRLYRAEIQGDSLVNVQTYFSGTYGRLRTVEPTLDGNLWLTTSNVGDKDSIANNSDEKLFKVLLGR